MKLIHLQPGDNLYLDEGVAGFTKQLTDDGVVERQVDLLLVGVAYAIREALVPVDTLRRHDLVRVAAIDPTVRLGLEAGLAWYAREQQLVEPETPRELLDLLARAGSTALIKLKKDWGALTKGQLRYRLLDLGRHKHLSQR